MDRHDPIFSDRFSVAFIGNEEGKGCDSCRLPSDYLAFECLAQNGGWSHLFCVAESEFEELHSLTARAMKALREEVE
jgi:hypothetical protein